MLLLRKGQINMVPSPGEYRNSKILHAGLGPQQSLRAASLMGPLQYIRDQARLRPPRPYMHQPLKVELPLQQSSPEGPLLHPLPLNKTFSECTLPHLPRLPTPRLVQLLRQHRAIQVKSLVMGYSLGLLGLPEQLLHLVQFLEPPQDQFLQ